MLREFQLFVAQVGNLQPIENRRRARPTKLLRRGRQSSLNRIHLNISNNTAKLCLVANQSIIALPLPKRTPSECKEPVTLPSGKSLERLHDVRNLAQRCHQEMHMVRHDNVGVQIELLKMSIVNRFHQNICNFWPLEKKWPSASCIEEPVHGEKGFSEPRSPRQAVIGRQASVQSPSKEYGLTNGIIVRQPSPMKRSHKERVNLRGKALTFCVAQVGNLQPIEKRPAPDLVTGSFADFQSAAGFQPALQK
jgi:hypothetical protein